MALPEDSIINGRYQLVKALSSGGMGEVYVALDLSNRKRKVAIKRMLLERLVEQAEAQTLEEGEENAQELVARKFDEEVEVLAGLDFPGIPRLIDNFEYEGAKCIVMEFIEGKDLSGLLHDYMKLTRQPMPEDKVVDYGIQLCHILEHLHSRAPEPIVHRDVKPANIILRERDRKIYLVDFGLARGISTDTTKTLVGTLGYAPLEQFEGKPEPRSDQYALGATLYHLLTGKTPAPFQLVPLGEVRPDLDDLLVGVVDRAISTKAEDRYPNMKHMRLNLVEVHRRLVSHRLDPRTAAEREAPSSPATVIESKEPATAPVPTFSRTVYPEDGFDLSDIQEFREPLHRQPPVIAALLAVVMLAMVWGWRFWNDRQMQAQGVPILSSQEKSEWRVEQLNNARSQGGGLRLDFVEPQLRSGVFFSQRRQREASGFSFQLEDTVRQARLLVFSGNKGIFFHDDVVGNGVRMVPAEIPQNLPESKYRLNFVTFRPLGAGVLLGTFQKAEVEVVFGQDARVRVSLDSAPARDYYVGHDMSWNGPISLGALLPFREDSGSGWTVSELELVR